MNRFQFVADHSDTYPVKRLCQVIDIARSSYYAWINAAEKRAARAAADAELADKIRAVHTVDNTYGRPRITAEINHGQTRRPADQSQTDRTDHARQQHRGPATAPKTPHHHRRTSRHSVAGPAQP